MKKGKNRARGSGCFLPSNEGSLSNGQNQRGFFFVFPLPVYWLELTNRTIEDELLNTVAVNAFPASGTRRRVDNLKILLAIRETLHNDDPCIPFYESYCQQFERILHAVTLSTNAYEVESCITLADLVEEYLSSLILTHSLTKQRVQIEKDKVVDWEFWIHVVQRMLSSDNCHTELRALAFLFNVWDNIPIGNGQGRSIHRPPSEGSNLEFHVDDREGLRWSCTVWLLSPPMWKRYFCHWQPLVRAYYHRILCWRVASAGPESDLLSSILLSNYSADARELLARRLKYSYSRVARDATKARSLDAAGPAFEAAPPVVNRKLSIFLNPAARSPPTFADNRNMNGGSAITASQHLHRVHAFDVFDDYAYSYPAMASSFDSLFPHSGVCESQ
jgi:hypothetical protein